MSTGAVLSFIATEVTGTSIKVLKGKPAGGYNSAGRTSSQFSKESCKHIDARFHFVRELVALRSRRIKIHYYVPTVEQHADLPTKALLTGAA